MSKMKTSDDVILALDLGTSFVKAIMARTNEDGSLEIIGSGKAEQFSSSMNAGAIIDIPTVTAVCEQAIGAVEKMADIRAKNTVIGISGDFIKGKTSRIRYTRDSDKPISEIEMLALLQKVQDADQKDAEKEISIETADPSAEVRLVNSSVVSVEVDGSIVNNPIGVHGKEVIVSFYTAFAPAAQIRAIEKVCVELGLNLISVVVEPFAICHAYLGNNPKNDFSAIFIDVGGGTTDIALVEKGGITYTKSFALGTDCLAKDFSVWLSGIEMAINEISKLKQLPSTIILSGGGANYSNLGEALAISDWYKTLNFTRRPVVSILEPSEFAGFSYNPIEFELDGAYATSLGLLKVAHDALANNLSSKFRKKR